MTFHFAHETSAREGTWDLHVLLLHYSRYILYLRYLSQYLRLLAFIMKLSDFGGLGIFRSNPTPFTSSTLVATPKLPSHLTMSI